MPVAHFDLSLFLLTRYFLPRRELAEVAGGRRDGQGEAGDGLAQAAGEVGHAPDPGGEVPEGSAEPPGRNGDPLGQDQQAVRHAGQG